MLKYLAILPLALFILSVQANAQAHKTKQASKSNHPANPVTRVVPQQDNAPSLQNETEKHVDADVRVIQSPAKDGYDKAAFWINFSLAIVGLGGICVAICTLLFVRSQVVEMRHQRIIMARTLLSLRKQGALMDSQGERMASQVELMQRQIDIAIDRERARISIALEPLQFNLQLPRIVTQKVKWKIRVFGQTEAVDVRVHVFPCVGNPTEHDLFKSVFGERTVPDIITPSEKEVTGECHFNWKTSTGESTFEIYLGSIVDRSATLYCAGHLLYSDLFGGKWIIQFNKEWVLHDEIREVSHLDLPFPSGYWLNRIDPVERPAEESDYKPN